MKYLILGSGGMVGHTLALYLQERGHNVTGFSREKIDLFPSVVGDAMETEPLETLIKSGEFDVIVNCIAILNQFAEEHRSAAVYLNAFFPHRLADMTKALPTKVIHISSDGVFSGERGQYAENDLRDGRNFYSRTKALGEIEDDKNLTLRTSLIGPDINPGGIGLFNWFMRQEGKINGYSRMVWTGLTSLQLGRLIEKLSLLPVVGLVHAVPPTAIAKHDLLCLFNHYFKGNSLHILPQDSPARDFSLKQSACMADLLRITYDDMIKDMRVWVDAHPSLYPAYFPLDA